MEMNLSDWGNFCSSMEFSKLDLWVGGGVEARSLKRRKNMYVVVIHHSKGQGWTRINHYLEYFLPPLSKWPKSINLHTPPSLIFTTDNIVMWFMAMIISNRN